MVIDSASVTHTRGVSEELKFSKGGLNRTTWATERGNMTCLTLWTHLFLDIRHSNTHQSHGCEGPVWMILHKCHTSFWIGKSCVFTVYILTIIPLHVGKTIFKKLLKKYIYFFKWKGQHFLQTWILLKTCGISWVDRVDCRASKLCLTPESQWPKGCPSRKVGCQALVDNKSTCNWRLRAHDKLLRRWHFLVVVYLCC